MSNTSFCAAKKMFGSIGNNESTIFSCNSVRIGALTPTSNSAPFSKYLNCRQRTSQSINHTSNRYNSDTYGKYFLHCDEVIPFSPKQSVEKVPFLPNSRKSSSIGYPLGTFGTIDTQPNLSLYARTPICPRKQSANVTLVLVQ